MGITINYLPKANDIQTIKLPDIKTIKFENEFVEIKTRERSVFITIDSIISIDMN